MTSLQDRLEDFRPTADDGAPAAPGGDGADGNGSAAVSAEDDEKESDTAGVAGETGPMDDEQSAEPAGTELDAPADPIAEAGHEGMNVPDETAGVGEDDGDGEPDGAHDEADALEDEASDEAEADSEPEPTRAAGSDADEPGDSDEPAEPDDEADEPAFTAPTRDDLRRTREEAGSGPDAADREDAVSIVGSEADDLGETEAAGGSEGGDGDFEDAPAEGSRKRAEDNAQDADSDDLPPSYPPTRRVRPLPVPGEEDEDERPSRRRSRLSTIAVVLVVLVVAALIKTYVVQTFEIPSGSMENTLQTDDRVSVRMYNAHDVNRGDVVVFVDPGGWLNAQDPSGLRGLVRDGLILVRLLPEDSGHHLIKRVIGVAGDRVTADGTGAVRVNGMPLDETYLRPGVTPSAVAFDVTVPEGCVWVMGDNRSNSLDSRFHQDDPHGGAVPLDDVVGVATNVVWPPGRWESLGSGEAVFADVPGSGR